jgi:hypothetical protein
MEGDKECTIQVNPWLFFLDTINILMLRKGKRTDYSKKILFAIIALNQQK